MLLSRVKQNIEKYKMFSNVETILIGISGGIDSSVLTQLVTLLAGREKIKVVLCHLNHSFRGSESDRDEAFVKNLAFEYGVLFESDKIDMPKVIATSKEGSAQSLSRGKRFDFFQGIASKYKTNSLFLAHNLDDLCETFLLRLFRGSGTLGLSAIKIKTKYKDLIVNRPLLTISRDDIGTYARDFKIKFVEDSSNDGDKYDRNKLRHHLLPFIKQEFNANFINTIKNVTDLIKSDEDYFISNIDKKLTEVVIEKSKKKYVLDLVRFNDMHLSF